MSQIQNTEEKPYTLPEHPRYIVQGFTYDKTGHSWQVNFIFPEYNTAMGVGILFTDSGNPGEKYLTPTKNHIVNNVTGKIIIQEVGLPWVQRPFAPPPQGHHWCDQWELDQHLFEKSEQHLIKRPVSLDNDVNLEVWRAYHMYQEWKNGPDSFCRGTYVPVEE